VATGGSGHVFIDTRPLTATDMQGSARIAARVAADVTGYSFQNHDFFFVVRSETPVIGGPSAGSVMATAAVAALENAHREPGEKRWEFSPKVMATGTISPDGTVGPVGGILTKAEAARDAGARQFLVPDGQGEHTPQHQSVKDRVGSGPVNVSAYCAEELGIECREVRTIEQLVRYATGHRFAQPELGDPPTTATYRDTLQPLSQRLVDRAERVYDVWDRLNASDVEPENRQIVQDVIDRSVSALEQAKASLAEEEFYSAASQSFQSSIHSRTADSLLAFLERGRSLDYVQETIDEARANTTEVRRLAENATLQGIQDVYTVGAAQERVSEAESRLQAAEQALSQRSVREAIDAAAFAHERARTVEWWLDLGDTFGPGPAMQRDVAELADEFVDVAEEVITYASSVSQRQPQAAQERLQRAKADQQRGFHAAALLEATEAQVLATLPLELANGGATQKAVDQARREAGQAIQEARGAGVEPILPVAVFEFAGAQNERALELQFYRSARVLAGFSTTLTGSSTPTDSVYEGEVDPPTPVQPPNETDESHEGEDAQAEGTSEGHANTASQGTPPSAAVGGFVAGLVVATVVATLVASGRGD
jgi:uncharacterized protein